MSVPEGVIVDSEGEKGPEEGEADQRPQPLGGSHDGTVIRGRRRETAQR
jgi:hypothetical protein